ncbi:arylsulfatase H-like [Penaeus japonicus]|uniref:arylsulfatase H-like n=1 Tax=Penaeus japonicus TaxID=27405 RepID=UPI001C70F151|nr:arylsulfatase H-like [Penaeus japonicus]
MVSWRVLSFLVVAGVVGTTTAAGKRPPNILVMLADDLGIGDVGCYGNTTIRTPNIDKLASQGMKLTHHLAAAAMCTPSRAALLTSRYPSRYGLVGSDGWGSPVIAHVASQARLPLDEVTLATALLNANYTTALVGKWHLGSFCNFLGRSCPGPLNHGFQTFFGIPVTLFFEFRGPYPFWKFDLEKPEYQRLLGTWVVAMVSLVLGRKYFSWKLRSIFFLLLVVNALFFVYWFTVAHVGINKECLWGVSPWLQRMANSLLMRQDKVVEQPIQLDGLSQRLVKESREFLKDHAKDDKPFFLFHSFGHVHTPMYSAPHMTGVSKHGSYGDNVEELDEGVGALMAALKEHGLEDNTIVYFTSDQGAHLEAMDLEGRRIGGYNGRFKGGKVMGGAEGGIRVAGIYRYPGHIPAGKTLDTPTSLMDLMPTVLDLAGLPNVHDIMAKSHSLMERKALDGESIADLLKGETRPPSHPPRIFLHHCRKNVHAVRLVTDKHIYKMYLYKHKWHPGSTQCGWGHSVGCHCHPTWMHDLTKQPELYDLKVDPYEEKDPINPNTKEYKEVVGHLQRHLEEWHRNVHYPTPQLTSLFEVAWTPWMQPVCLNC